MDEPTSSTLVEYFMEIRHNIGPKFCLFRGDVDRFHSKFDAQKNLMRPVDISVLLLDFDRCSFDECVHFRSVVSSGAGVLLMISRLTISYRIVADVIESNIEKPTLECFCGI